VGNQSTKKKMFSVDVADQKEVYGEGAASQGKHWVLVDSQGTPNVKGVERQGRVSVWKSAKGGGKGYRPERFVYAGKRNFGQ